MLRNNYREPRLNKYNPVYISYLFALHPFPPVTDAPVAFNAERVSFSFYYSNVQYVVSDRMSYISRLTLA